MMRARNLALIAMLVTAPATAIAQGQNNSTMSEAGKIAARPAHDVGIGNKKVPPVLQRAADAPYSLNGTASCAQLSSNMRALSGALGPDFGERTPVSGSKAGQIAKVGGEALVDSIIPFRGLVREVSGAAAAQRRLQAATYAGLARRGFLRGLYRARRCAPAL